MPEHLTRRSVVVVTASLAAFFAGIATLFLGAFALTGFRAPVASLYITVTIAPLLILGTVIVALFGVVFGARYRILSSVVAGSLPLALFGAYLFASAPGVELLGETTIVRSDTPRPRLSEVLGFVILGSTLLSVVFGVFWSVHSRANRGAP